MVAEANVLGTPVVVSDGIPADVVVNGYNGIVYPFGDINALSAALTTLLIDQTKWQELSANASEWARRFTWENSSKTLNQMLNEVQCQPQSDVQKFLNYEQNQSLGFKSFYEKEGLSARRYDSKRFWERRYHQKKATLVHSAIASLVSKGTLVLDAGSGTGEIGLTVKGLGGRVVSVDLAKSYLMRMGKSSENRVCATLNYLPFKSSVFEVVLCNDVLEHLPSYDQAIAELHRVSSHYAVITTPCNGINRELFAKLFPAKLAYLDSKVGHLEIVPLSELERRLSRTGWSVAGRSYHVIQPLADNILSKKLSGIVGLIEKIADILLPTQGTISLAVASNEGRLAVKSRTNR